MRRLLLLAASVALTGCASVRWSYWGCQEGFVWLIDQQRNDVCSQLSRELAARHVH